LSDVGGTVASRRLGAAHTAGVVVPVSALMLVAIFLATGAALPSDAAVVLLCASGGVIGSVTYFSAYAALRRGPISVVIPIMFTYGGVAVLFSILFLDERPAPASIAAAAIATVGVTLLGLVHAGRGRLALSGRGVAYAVVVVFAVAGTTVVGTLAVRQ